MARKEAAQNGHDRLEEAMATLIQNKASFVNRLAESDPAHVEMERRHLAEIIRVLAEHGRLLERLPEAVRDKIGFKGH